jgi:hypothetical protein
MSPQVCRICSVGAALQIEAHGRNETNQLRGKENKCGAAAIISDAGFNI